jgi:hypothetical protein
METGMGVMNKPATTDKTLVGNLAYLLSEPFGVQDPEIISQVASITRDFNAFVHLIDDVTDERMPAKQASGLVHLGIDKLFESLSTGLQMANHPELLFSKLNQYWKETSIGERYLWKHHACFEAYRNEDFAMLGKRGSFGKVPIAVYADISGRNELVAPLENGFEETGIAVQLFDDIFDWKMDLENKIYTHPIALAYNKVKRADHKSIEEGLFCRGAFNDSVLEALKHFELGKNIFYDSGAYEFALTLENLAKNALSLNAKADELKGNFGKFDITQELKSAAHYLLRAH